MCGAEVRPAPVLIALALSAGSSITAAMAGMSDARQQTDCAASAATFLLQIRPFDIMEWDEDLRYRFRGQFLEQGDNKMMLFAFDEPEMIKVEEIVLPPKENTEEDEGETVRKKIYIFPPEWAGTFGQPITSIAQVGILRQEHYAGNWDVFRPASEIEEMNTFTAESLNKLLHEAEKIMEGWTDYR